jgi:hypothetical protein
LIIYRGKGVLLAVDDAGNIHSPVKAHSRHYNLTWTKEAKEEGSVTFVIKNVTTRDASDYKLRIRRSGHADVEHRFTVVVRKAGLLLITFPPCFKFAKKPTFTMNHYSLFSITTYS